MCTDICNTTAVTGAGKGSDGLVALELDIESGRALLQTPGATIRAAELSGVV